MSLDSLKAEYAKARDLKNSYQQCIDDLRNWVNSASNTIRILEKLQEESLTRSEFLKQQIEDPGVLEESA